MQNYNKSWNRKKEVGGGKLEVGFNVNSNNAVKSQKIVNMRTIPI